MEDRKFTRRKKPRAQEPEQPVVAAPEDLPEIQETAPEVTPEPVVEAVVEKPVRKRLPPLALDDGDRSEDGDTVQTTVEDTATTPAPEVESTPAVAPKIRPRRVVRVQPAVKVEPPVLDATEDSVEDAVQDTVEAAVSDAIEPEAPAAPVIEPEIEVKADIPEDDDTIETALTEAVPDDVEPVEVVADEPVVVAPEVEPAPAPEPIVLAAADMVEDAPDPVVDSWDHLRVLTLNAAHLSKHRIITADRSDPSHTAFDVLRTRLLQALDEHGWKRVAITSPTKDCGKTFTAANLAISLSRQENCRTLLMDMDLRNPSLAKVLGVQAPGRMGDFLRGEVPMQDYLRRMGPNNQRIGRNMAVALNDAKENYASELMQQPKTREVLRDLEERLDPDVILYDLPPALYHDDVIAFRPHFDGVLLVIGGGITTKDEVKEVERRLGEDTPLLGVVLNKSEGAGTSKYSY